MSRRVSAVLPILMGTLTLALIGLPTIGPPTASGAAVIDTFQDSTGAQDFVQTCSGDALSTSTASVLPSQSGFLSTDISSAQAGIVTSSPANLVLRLQMLGPIPQSSEDMLAYGFALDVDNDAATGFGQNGIDLLTQLTFFQGERQGFVFVGPDAIEETTNADELFQATELDIGFNRGKLEAKLPLEALQEALPASYGDVQIDPGNPVMKMVAFTTWAPSDVDGVSLENSVSDFAPNPPSDAAAMTNPPAMSLALNPIEGVDKTPIEGGLVSCNPTETNPLVASQLGDADEGQGEEGEPQPPEILGMTSPDSIVGDGRERKVKVEFRDPNGDIVKVRINELQGAPPHQEVSFNPDVEGETEGTFNIIVSCDNNGDSTFPVKAEVTLIDAEELESNTETFSYQCLVPEE